MSDIEIARSCIKKNIKDICSKVGLSDDLYEVVVNDELGVAVLVNTTTNVSLELKEFLYEILNMTFIKYDKDDE